MNILPTPPRTTHKNKENRPPTPVTPANSKQRVLHIAWSQENLHHAYSTEVRPLPSSGSIKAPSKTILKKPKTPFMNHSSPDQPSRYITPEPADPLQQSNYLSSPISTLVASCESHDCGPITLIDLTEAYSELLRRLKSRGPMLLDIYGPIPALSPLREHSAQLTQAFRRDIERACIDPQMGFNPNELATSEDIPWSSPSSTESVKKRGFTEQEIKYARDLCNLSHTAIRCFSTFAVVPALYSVFSDEQLADILTGVLTIPLSPAIPTPNARKTCQLAIWALQVQRLPSAVLAPAADRITYAIRRGIDGELGREGKNGAASDGFKAIVALAEHKPEIFMTPFAELLPSILATLTSSNLALRVEAANALLGLASSLSAYQDPPPALLASFSLAIGTYLYEQHQARKPGQELSPVGKNFRTCLNAETPTHAAQSPMWALSCIAAFIVLSRSDALSQPRTIKFILTHLQTAMAAKRTTVRATAGLVWRALIWSCLHLDEHEGETEEKKCSAWKVVRQLVDGAIGISVVAALVGRQSVKSKRLGQAIEVINAMIKKGGKTCEEAVDVLERLLHGVGQMLPTEYKWDENTLLAQPIFDGTLLRADWKALTSHVKSGLDKSAAIQDIVPLTEGEVGEYWEDLFRLWREAIGKAPLEENGDVPTPLLNSWKALLLVQAQRNQDADEMFSDCMLPAELTGALKSFLTDTSLDWSLGPTAPAWSPQPLKIGFVRNLWIYVRKIFPSSALHTAANMLLHEIIVEEFSLRQAVVSEAWLQLFTDLCSSLSAEHLRSIWHGEICSRRDVVLQDLWGYLGKSWVLNAGHYLGTLELICAPLDFSCEINLSQDDLGVWSNLIEHAIVSASVYKVERLTILESIASRVSFSRHTMAICAVLPCLLSFLSIPSSNDTSILPQTLLKLTNDVMVATYPPADRETKIMIFSSLRFLGEILGHLPAPQIVQALCLIQEGAAAWVGDKSEELTENEFNEEVVPFYGECLKSLAKVPPSADTLSKLSSFLVSTFNRIPKPALGPSLFKAFWIKTYQHYPSTVLYPEPLKSILRSIQEIMCEPEEVLAPGISQATGTPSQEWVIGSGLSLDDANNQTGREQTSDQNGISVDRHQDESDNLTGPADVYPRRKVTQDASGVKKEPSELQLSNASTPNHSSHRKRRKSSSSLSKKKRKTESQTKTDVEIINVSDNDDGKSTIEDSIVIVRTPISSKRPHGVESANDKTNAADKVSPKRRKLGNKYDAEHLQPEQAPLVLPHQQHDNSGDSDSSLPSSRRNRLSARFISSPRIRKSRSEPLENASDDFPMSSSPLKSVMARRQLRRSYTAPSGSQLGSKSDGMLMMSDQSSRSPSEGFAALEQAHEAITKGGLAMGVEELLKASKMLNGISVVLNEQISKKLASSQPSDDR